MVKKILASIATCLLLSSGFAQQPEQVLNRWATQNPIEKIYIHSDRSDYIAGQTIWFKAYALSDFLPDARSTDLFVELISPAASIINRMALPLFAGFAHGQVELPDTLSTGQYTLRAYTASMLNHDEGFVYTKNFFVFNSKKKERPAQGQPAVRLEFFPEGGSFVTGLSNSIAFKASAENGLPVEVTGSIKNEKGDKVAEFSSYHDGMGYFDLLAEEKNNYYAVLNGDPSGKKYSLPAQTTGGVVFRVISTGATKSFEILQRAGDPMFKASYMIGQMQHHVVFKKTFSKDKDEITGIIPADKLSSGIMQLTVFNKQGIPLAERLTFVDNKEYVQHGDIVVDTLSFSDRAKNRFTLSLKDTVQGSFSVSISDPAFDLLPSRQENIFSGLLLTSDLKGYVHNPAYYFTATSDSVQNALDLLMMTNGWRRFRWDAMKDPLPANKFTDPGYIILSGKINLEGTKKPFADKDLLLYVLSPNSGKSMQLLHTDAEGHFSLDSAVFFGKSFIFLTDIKGKKSRFIEVKMDADSLFRPYMLPSGSPVGYTLAAAREKKMQEEYDAAMKAEGVTLDVVTLKSRKKTALEETEEQYVSGLFSGNANSTLDLTKENMAGYRDIFDYLKMRVPGLQVLKDPEGPGYIIEYRQTASASAMGEIPMTIFLNEVPSDADAITPIPPYEIALVKVYSNFVGAWGNAPGGVLAIYTKKDADLRASIPTAGQALTYRGYSVVKEFYSPDYTVAKTDEKPDQRVTLYWNPAIIVNGVNAKIPLRFYNNDRTRQFKIVVEGVTGDGKLLMIEKTIGAKAF